jgi:hypothetical protein
VVERTKEGSRVEESRKERKMANVAFSRIRELQRHWNMAFLWTMWRGKGQEKSQV